MAESLHQEVSIPAPPSRIYQALTEAAAFSAFTGGAPAAIDASPGGAFTCFGGMITGRNVELVPDRRVVQAWRAATWPEGIYSIARFELAAEDGGTRVTFDQSGFPNGQDAHLEPGWHKMYWEPLRQHLA